jgi:hypothetical protein
MHAFAARNDDLNLPDEVVLPFIMNFLTDERLRKLSSAGPSGGLQKWTCGARAHFLAFAVSQLSAEDWPKRLEPFLAMPRSRCGCRFHPLDWIDRLSMMAKKLRGAAGSPVEALRFRRDFSHFLPRGPDQPIRPEPPSLFWSAQ